MDGCEEIHQKAPDDRVETCALTADLTLTELVTAWLVKLDETSYNRSQRRVFRQAAGVHFSPLIDEVIEINLIHVENFTFFLPRGR